jgi:hypothetical protein
MRLAWHLAQREVRRRPGRTSLVVLLVAVTVAGVTVSDVVYRTRQLPTPAALGRAAAKSALSMNGRDQSQGVATILSLVPSGVDAVAGWEAFRVPVQRFDRPGLGSFPMLSTVDATRPLLAGFVRLRAGRLPSGAGEALLGPTTAVGLELGVGDILHLARPRLDLAIVGIGSTAEASDLLLAPGYSVRGFAANFVSAVVYTSVLMPIDTSTCCGKQGTYSMHPNLLTPPPPPVANYNELLIAWLVATLVLSVLGIVIAAAFAASGRRQLVTLGQLGATGGDERFARQFLGLQGLVTGLVGAALGVAGGLAAASAAETFWRNANRPRVVVGDLAVVVLTTTVVATVAALVPTRGLTKAPVLAALAGRAPVSQVRRGQLRIAAAVGGLGLVVLGVAVAATHSGHYASLTLAAALLGGAAVLGSVCLLAPIVVDRWGALADRSGGAVRLAARSMVRHRARSASLVAAIVAIGALGVAGAAGIERGVRLDERPVAAPRLDMISASVRSDAQPAKELELIESIVGTVHWTSLPTVADANGQYWVVADQPALTTLGVSAAFLPVLQQLGTAQLIRGGPVVDSGGSTWSFVAPNESKGLVVPSVALITPDAVAALGHTDAGRLMVGATSHELSSHERDQLGFVSLLGRDPLYAGTPLEDRDLAQLDSLVWETPYHAPLGRTAVRWMLIGALLLLVTLVVALGLALWSAEGKVERDQMVAVGASPRVLAHVAGVRAWLLASTGGVIAVPVGMVTLWVVLSAKHTHAPFPWLTAAMVAVGLPAVIAGGAYMSSLVSQRLRPVSGASISLD